MIKNDSSDKECDRQKFFSFWDIFCLLTPLTTHKIKTFKKYPPPLGDIISQSAPKIMIIGYSVPEI